MVCVLRGEIGPKCGELAMFAEYMFSLCADNFY